MTVEVHRANTGDLKTLSDRLVLDVQGKGRRLSTRTIRAIVKARYRQAGVVGHRKTTHSLRHSAITNTIRHKATPIQVQAMTRHTSTHTTLGYFYGENRTANLAGDFITYEPTSDQALVSRMARDVPRAQKHV